MKSQPLRRLSFLRALQASRRSTRRRRRTFNRLYAPPTDEDQEAVGGSVPGVLCARTAATMEATTTLSMTPSLRRVAPEIDAQRSLFERPRLAQSPLKLHEVTAEYG